MQSHFVISYICVRVLIETMWVTIQHFSTLSFSPSQHNYRDSTSFSVLLYNFGIYLPDQVKFTCELHKIFAAATLLLILDLNPVEL